MPTASTVLADYSLLSPTEQNQVKSSLLSPTFITGRHLHSFVETNRFVDGRKCVYCSSSEVVRNGHRPDHKQRFFCKDCKKSFVATSNTITSKSRKRLAVWEKYIDCMLSGMTIRDTAHECGINKNTAFIWRHKILDALQTMMNEVKLDGIVEADETFFPVSYKGNHKKSKTFIMPRSAHHRGKSIKKRGLSDEQVCVPCIVNRDGLSVAKISNLARLKEKGLSAIFSGKIEPGSVLVTDKTAAYKKFSISNNLELKQLKSGLASRKGIYNLQHINSYHSRLKLFMERFRGVSTKHLNNYLVWHNYVNYSKSEYDEKKKELLRYVLGVRKKCLWSAISAGNPLPVLA